MGKMDYEILSDGNTVWINSPAAIGRFGRFGIDIHRSLGEQSEKGECLHCTHGQTDNSSWKEFVVKMQEHYGITVGEEHKPKWLKKSLKKGRENEKETVNPS